MSEMGWTVGIITAITALIAIFFGKPFWNVFSGLVGNQAKSIGSLEKRERQLEAQVDRVEALYHEQSEANIELQYQLDTYVNMAQSLTNELAELRRENEELRRVNRILTQRLDLRDWYTDWREWKD